MGHIYEKKTKIRKWKKDDYNVMYIRQSVYIDWTENDDDDVDDIIHWNEMNFWTKPEKKLKKKIYKQK